MIRGTRVTNRIKKSSPNLESGSLSVKRNFLENMRKLQLDVPVRSIKEEAERNWRRKNLKTVSKPLISRSLINKIIECNPTEINVRHSNNSTLKKKDATKSHTVRFARTVKSGLSSEENPINRKKYLTYNKSVTKEQSSDRKRCTKTRKIEAPSINVKRNRKRKYDFLDKPKVSTQSYRGKLKKTNISPGVIDTTKNNIFSSRLIGLSTTKPFTIRSKSNFAKVRRFTSVPTGTMKMEVSEESKIQCEYNSWFNRFFRGASEFIRYLTRYQTVVPHLAEIVSCPIHGIHSMPENKFSVIPNESEDFQDSTQSLLQGLEDMEDDTKFASGTPNIEPHHAVAIGAITTTSMNHCVGSSSQPLSIPSRMHSIRGNISEEIAGLVHGATRLCVRQRNETMNPDKQTDEQGSSSPGSPIQSISDRNMDNFVSCHCSGSSMDHQGTA